MHGHQKKPALFYSLFKLTALCALFHEAAAQASTTTLAGGKAGFKDGDAASAQFDQPTGVAMHPKGFLLVADWKNHRIRKVDPTTGETTTLAGSTEGFNDGVGTSARFSSPMGIAIDPHGDFALVSDGGNSRIRKIDLMSAETTTLAGTGIQGLKDGDGTSAAQFFNPNGIAIDPKGTFALVADRFNHRIRKIDLESRETTTLAGSGTYSGYINHRLGHEYIKDDAVGTNAGFFYPNGIAIDPEGSFALVADWGTHRIRKIDLLTTATTTLAGSGREGGFNDGTFQNGKFKFPFGIAIDRTGAFALIADTSNHRIRKLDLKSEKVTTLAGTGIRGVDEGDAGTIAQFAKPRAIAIDPEGAFAFVADTENNRIRKLALPCRYDMEITGYGGRASTKVTFDAAQGARWDDFDTCLGKDDAVGTVAEGAAADCSDRFGLKVTVLRLTGSDEVVATGFCCNTDITVKSVSSPCLAP